MYPTNRKIRISYAYKIKKHKTLMTLHNYFHTWYSRWIEQNYLFC